MWMIDSAPFFLGLFALMGGIRQSRVLQLNEELNAHIIEQKQLSDQLSELKEKLQSHIEKQLVQLKAAAQVAREASAIHDLDRLLEDTVNLISERFGFYHAGIFLIDERNEYAIFCAASSEGGKWMLARNHKLAVGKVGIVGYVAWKGEPRIALDVGEDAVFFNNPDLPLTRSEMALPLKARQKIIGVLDVQSTQAGAFGDEDISILQTLADQLALAIDNARLFAETQLTVEELDELNRRLVTQAWRPYQTRYNSVFSYDRLGVRPVTELSTIAQHLGAHQLSLPIQFRDQTIGTITLERDQTQSEWTASEIDVFKTVVNQLGLALENERTLADLQRRTEQERLISDISARLWASADINTIVRTAAQEIGNSFEVSNAVIQLEIPTQYGADDKH
jgi:GAF domain-containing protein